jgi:hypothetical protein
MPASLFSGTAQLKRQAIPQALITVAIPARSTGPSRVIHSSGRSAGDSQVHSPPALVSGFHLVPTLWTSLRRLLVLFPVFRYSTVHITLPPFAHRVKSD